MTVIVRADGVVALEGSCGAADAEALQTALLKDRQTSVEWSACDHLHAAVLQVLLAARRPVRGAPRSAFLRAHQSQLVSSGLSSSRNPQRFTGGTE